MFASGPEISHVNLQSYFGRRSEGRGRPRQLQTDSVSFCTSECLRSCKALMDSVSYCQIPSRHHNCRNDESLKSSFLPFCLEIDAGGPATSSSLAEAAWSMQPVLPTAAAAAACQGIKVVLKPGSVGFRGCVGELTLWWRTTTAKCVLEEFQRRSEINIFF